MERRKIAPYIKKGQPRYVGKGFLKFTTHTYITAVAATAALARIQWLGNILYEVERTKRKSKERDISGEAGVRNIISLLVCAHRRQIEIKNWLCTQAGKFTFTA